MSRYIRVSEKNGLKIRGIKEAANILSLSQAFYLKPAFSIDFQT